MYKLIFADDEALVRNNVARLLQWETCGFTLAGCCSNGYELVEQVKRDPPDLVIADINMPFINGIEAAREIRQEFPQVKIAFLTGHDDFDYARQAIDLHVMKYILKPVTSESLTEILREIRAEIDEEYRQAGNLKALSAFYQENRAVVQSLFLNGLLSGTVTDQEAKEKVGMLELNCLDASDFQTAVILPDPMPSDCGFSQESPEMALFAIYNMGKELMETREVGMAVLGGKDVTLIACGRSGAPYLDRAFTSCLEELRAVVEKHLHFTVTVGKGAPCRRCSEICHSHEGSLAALGYRESIGRNRVISIQDIEPKRQDFKVYCRVEEERLVAAIKLADSEQVEALLGELSSALLEPAGPVQQRFCTFSILLSLLREADTLGLNTDEILSESDLQEVFAMRVAPEMLELIRKTCRSMMKSVQLSRKKSCSAAMDQARQIIAEHLTDPELSADFVSDTLHLSASYFRALFKKEIGATFVNYLTEMRMEKAKDLILTSGKKNYEIAEETGYADPHYFSYCFKKYYGKSPNEFRESIHT